MRAIDRLYKREEIITRSLHIDEDLYTQVQYLSETVFDASVSKIINVCVENTLLKDKPIKFYKKKIGTDAIYRSVLFRRSFFEKLLEIKDTTGISFSRIVNGCINEFLEDYKDELEQKMVLKI